MLNVKVGCSSWMGNLKYFPNIFGITKDVGDVSRVHRMMCFAIGVAITLNADAVFVYRLACRSRTTVLLVDVIVFDFDVQGGMVAIDPVDDN